MTGAPIRIPVARPSLPPAEALLPYLRRIDDGRIYANFGPLARELEARLAAHYGLGAGTVVTVANGTIGLTLALVAQAPPPGSLCLLPSWTFMASAHAVRAAGLVPWFGDVGAADWALDPGGVPGLLRAAPGPVGAVMVVAPFGAPLDVAAWCALARALGVALVIDAAAGFDSLVPADYPAMVSLHATKALAAGEGGAVVCRDAAMIAEIRRRANFGMLGSRRAMVPAFNGKMSEYHAAVALAALDRWPEDRRRWQAVAGAYLEALDALNGVALQPGWGREWVTSTCVVETIGESAVEAAARLAAAGIDTRRWWNEGCHREPAFADCGRAPLPETERIAAHNLGLPFAIDLEPAAVARVAAALAAAGR